MCILIHFILLQEFSVMDRFRWTDTKGCPFSEVDKARVCFHGISSIHFNLVWPRCLVHISTFLSSGLTSTYTLLTSPVIIFSGRHMERWTSGWRVPGVGTWGQGYPSHAPMATGNKQLRYVHTELDLLWHFLIYLNIIPYMWHITIWCFGMILVWF